MKLIQSSLSLSGCCVCRTRNNSTKPVKSLSLWRLSTQQYRKKSSQEIIRDLALFLDQRIRVCEQHSRRRFDVKSIKEEVSLLSQHEHRQLKAFLDFIDTSITHAKVDSYAMCPLDCFFVSVGVLAIFRVDIHSLCLSRFTLVRSRELRDQQITTKQLWPVPSINTASFSGIFISSLHFVSM